MCIRDRATALKMHDKVRVYWAAETERVRKELGELHYQPGAGMTPEQARRDLRMAELKQRLAVLTTTDMALIVSPGQNEMAQMQVRGLDIAPHRNRMNESQPGLDAKIKDNRTPRAPCSVWGEW